MTSLHRRRVVETIAVLVAFACGALPTAASADAGGPAFGTPQLVDSAQPYSVPWSTTEVSCGSASHCVALGRINPTDTIEASTTDPAASSGTPEWSTPADTGLTGFSPEQLTCPTASICAAVGTTSAGTEVVGSADGGTTWSVVGTLSSTAAVSALGCTTTGQCVAVDQDGNAFYGAASGTAGWSGPSSLTSVSGVSFNPSSASCSGADTCVVTAATKKDAVLLTSTDMSNATPGWTATQTDAKRIPQAISCSSGGTCVAVDNAGNAVVSTNDGGSWTVDRTGDTTSLWAVSCPDDSDCLIADQDGDAVLATGLSAASPAFTEIAGPPAGGSSSCASITQCFSAGGTVSYGQIDTTASPPSAIWSRAYLSGSDPLADLTCSATGGVCAAADSTGRVMVSGDGGTTWSSPAAPTGVTTQPNAISCTPDGSCVVVAAGFAYTAAGIGPGGAAPSWSGGTALPDTGKAVTGLSCPSDQLCVAVDTGGNTVVSTNPTASTPTWNSITTTSDGSALRSLSCPSTSLCVAGDSEGDVWYSTDPSSPTAWSGPDSVDPGQSITAISCDAAGACVAGDNAGQVLDTPSITGGAGSWSGSTSAGAGGTVTSVSCAGSGSCSAVVGGDATFGPSDVQSGNWSQVSGSPSDLTGLACPTSAACVWSDSLGDVIPSTQGLGAMAVSAPGLSFAATALGTASAAQSETVSDSGSGPLTIGQASISGVAAGSFAVTGDDCSGTTLSPGETCVISLELVPAATGALTASLQIPSSDPAGPATLSLAGTGTAPAGSSTSMHTPTSHSSPKRIVAGRARFTRAAVTGTLIDAIVLCDGRSGERCATRLRLTAHEHLRGRQLVSVSHAARAGAREKLKIRTIALGSGSVTLTARHGRVVHLSLDATGRRLLRRLGTLQVTLTATQTVDGKTVRTRRFRLSFTTRHRR